MAMHFNGQRFTDSRALGQALHEADRARAKSFWKRRFHDLHQWITDTLGDYRLGRKLAKVPDRNLSRGQQVDLCILLLWPEAPIELHGVPLQKDALDKTAQLAWRGDETAAARLLKVASDSRVWRAYALDAGGEEIARIYEASWRAKEDYAKWRERLRVDVSIPEWRAPDPGTLDGKPEIKKVAGVKIAVDTSTGRPRLPLRIQAIVLGAEMGEETCTNGLLRLTERATRPWRDAEAWLGEAYAAGVGGSPGALAAALYGALEEAKHRRRRERVSASAAVWACYGIDVGLLLSTGFGIGSALLTGWAYWVCGAVCGAVLGAATASWTGVCISLVVGGALAYVFGLQIGWIYWVCVVAFASVGFLAGTSLGADVDGAEFLSPPEGRRKLRAWRRWHMSVALVVAAAAVVGLWVLSPPGP